MDLFDHQRKADTAAHAPLADRMRPRTLDEFFGQRHIVGPGRLLRRAIEADQLSSVIFYGPPGTGKTTLARIIAGTTQAHFVALNAVLAGVKDIRESVADATERRGLYGQRTILFIDEVHRFNKAQQDALLPWVENGTVILVGATTENPYFEVNKALVSRSRIFQLRPLTPEDLVDIARMTISDPERGYGAMKVQASDEAIAHLVDVAGGDARAVLNALELAVETTPPDAAGIIRVDLAVAEESIQRRAVLYDKEGDVHYDTISAFIKSIRGSDADASLYWLARMVYAGESPRFLFRRMLILAAEDVGLADPEAVRVVTACAEAFEYVGLPEGQFHLAEAALYLATAPKSNSALAYFDALSAVEKERADDVPSHLKDGNRDKEGFGHGAGYLYPHAYRDHWVAQQYLPDALQGRLFYQPSDQGHEGAIRSAIARQREAQLAAMLEGDAGSGNEILSNTGSIAGRNRERWLARTVSSTSAQLARTRDRIFDNAQLSRHSVVLDLSAGSGLLTWEALRRAPEGGVWALASDTTAADALERGLGSWSAEERPTILVGSIDELPTLLALRGESEVVFDAIVGRNALGMLEPVARAAALSTIHGLLAPDGHLSLAESLPGAGSMPSDLLGDAATDLLERVRKAESVYRARETSHHNASDAKTSKKRKQVPTSSENTPALDHLKADLESSGFAVESAEIVIDEGELVVTQALIARWFGGSTEPSPRSENGASIQSSEPGRYAAALATVLTADEINMLRERLATLAGGPPRPWKTAVAYVVAKTS